MNRLLLLVDGSSYLYRAYHALPDLRNAEGEPTGAIYGFLNMLHRLEKDYPTAYVACIFDAKGKTFRNDLYQEYKANRSAMPDDLARQTGPIHELVKMLGWPILSIEGIEADDVIGTLVSIAKRKGFDTVVSTGDKDMSQLVRDCVTLVNTMNNEIMDEEGVMRKFGVPPDRIVDYLSLVGDTSDNIPGVNKVGPKTAVKWLTQYGSLDAIIENAVNIKGTVGDNLRESLEWLPQARQLITIRTDCDLSGQFKSIEETLVKNSEDVSGLRKAYERYGFKNWLRELNARHQEKETKGQIDLFGEPGTKPEKFVAKQEYETVLTEEQFEKWLNLIDQAPLTSLDTETTSLDSMTARLVGISLSVKPGFAAYIPLAHHPIEVAKQLPLDHVLKKLKSWLENPAKKKVGQNLKYDSHIFANYHIHLQGIAHDTLLESYVLESHRRHDMDSLSERLLDYKPISYEEICGKGASQIGFDQIELDCATRYAAEDADITFQLHENMWPRIEKNEGLRFIYEKIEIPVSLVLQKMERNGVLIDPDLLLGQSSELALKIDELEKKAYSVAEQSFNLNSPKQLAEILFDKLGLPLVKKTPSGAPSTSEEVLEKLALDYPLPKIILDFRGMAKLKSTYTDKLPRMINPETGRVHTNYAQAVAVTGRLASNDPNLQNIPVKTEEGRRIREAFIAPAGCYIVSADYSQIELRIMAHLSDDPGLLKAFREGQDVHKATASEIFDIAPLEVTPEQRRYAKVINFGLIYGMSAFGVASNLGISRTDAKNYIDRYFRRYPGVAEYMDAIRQTAREQGYVETVFGRRLWLPEINSPNGPRRQAAERAAINAPMQGTAADIIKLSMIAVNDWIENEQLESKLIMQVHDELVLEVPDKELERVRKRLPELMGQVASLKVPLIADVGFGKNWEEAH
ncbi:DNA polymerase I [Oxalobacter paraformigenes]|uniref:DNA polymerase I n=1 Tax=Oxalobacter paraformigenes TaxID=556268 RepID=C3X5Y2_9BURK|nr:DNA polymerase I [Oxalobacter paraformigenes]EEO28618.1 DNA polymerase I [Oxalobacter paraformigenes]